MRHIFLAGAAKGVRGNALGRFPAGRGATPGEVSGRKPTGRGAAEPRRKAPIQRRLATAQPWRSRVRATNTRLPRRSASARRRACRTPHPRRMTKKRRRSVPSGAEKPGSRSPGLLGRLVILLGDHLPLAVDLSGVDGAAVELVMLLVDDDELERRKVSVDLLVLES